MDRGRRERGQEDGDVLRAFGSRRAVADPLARPSDDGLAGVDVERAAVVLDANHPAQDDNDLLELRTLTRLLPTRWRDHARDADAGVPGVDAARELFNAFRFGAGGRDDGRRFDEARHQITLNRARATRATRKARTSLRSLRSLRSFVTV